MAGLRMSSTETSVYQIPRNIRRFQGDIMVQLKEAHYPKSVSSSLVSTEWKMDKEELKVRLIDPTDQDEDLRFVKLKKQSNAHTICLYLIICVLIIIISSLLPKLGPHDPSQQFFSPAQNTIKYLPKVFHKNFFAQSEYYVGGPDGMPTNATDQLWNELYGFGVSAIDESTARKVPNRTVYLPNQPHRYVIQLDVFHQLHCLNYMRQAIFPERYADVLGDYVNPDGSINRNSGTAKHLGHCLDSVRQAIMCHGDLAATVWQYNDLSKKPTATLGALHTCRDFEQIKAWAIEHQIESDELDWPKGVPEDFPESF